MSAESFPGADGDVDDAEIVSWVSDGEARLLPNETLDYSIPTEFKGKLQAYLQDETVESVIIYCNRIAATPHLHGTLLAISRQNQVYGKRLLLRGVSPGDESAFAGFGWQVEERG